MSNIQQLRDYLEMERYFQKQILHHKHTPRFYGNADLMLQHGQQYWPVAHPYRKQTRGCYRRAYQMAARKDSRWIYVEGYAASASIGFVMAHAWVARKDQPDKAIDLAWEEPGLAYLGIPFRIEYVQSTVRKHRHYAVLEAWMSGWPLLTGEHNIEDAMWQPKLCLK